MCASVNILLLDSNWKMLPLIDFQLDRVEGKHIVIFWNFQRSYHVAYIWPVGVYDPSFSSVYIPTHDSVHFLQVREMAAVTLGGLLHCKYITLSKSLLVSHIVKLILNNKSFIYHCV